MTRAPKQKRKRAAHRHHRGARRADGPSRASRSALSAGAAAAKSTAKNTNQLRPMKARVQWHGAPGTAGAAHRLALVRRNRPVRLRRWPNASPIFATSATLTGSSPMLSNPSTSSSSARPASRSRSPASAAARPTRAAPSPLSPSALLAEFARAGWSSKMSPACCPPASGRDFGAILGALAKCGYGLAYRILDAQFFGVPQRRRRVFVVGCLGDWRAAAAVLFERDGLRRDPPARAKAGEGIAPLLEIGTGNSVSAIALRSGIGAPGDVRAARRIALLRGAISTPSPSHSRRICALKSP